MSYPISKIPDIDAAIAVKLKAQRIRTTAKLLESAKDVRGRQALAEKMGVDLVPIRWLAPQRFRALNVIAENIAILRRAQFVVTDVYHLIVTALRENRAVIGLGWGASQGRTTLADKKKELLLRSYFGSHLYVFIEDVINKEAEALERAMNGLHVELRSLVVRKVCHNHRTISEARLGRALAQVLAG